MAGIFNQAFGGGVQNGARLADVFQQRRDRNKLSQLAETFGQNQDFNALGSGLIGLGQVGQGINAVNVPYNREQQALQREFQNQQAQATQDQRAFQNDLALQGLGLRKDEIDYRRDPSNPANIPPAPNNTQWVDPQNPRLGVEPIQGLPEPQPKPLTAVGKIDADLRAGLINPEDAKILRFNATNKNGIRIGKDGTIQIGGSGKGKSATESQSNANIFATRGEEANLILSTIENEGTNFLATITSKAPLVGNFLQTPQYQQYDQAKRNMINAILRKESGAAIAPSEFENADKQYFPQPGDSVLVIKQKKKNRETAVRTMRQASGPFAGGNSTPVANPDEPNSQSNPMGIGSESDADNLPSGTWVIINGRIGQVE